MASQEYENIGLGSMPLFRWFRHVARSFETGVGTVGCKLLSKGSDGVLYPSHEGLGFTGKAELAAGWGSPEPVCAEQH
jgi:hypothetical protein